jgi:hypothetical protein
MLAIDFYNVPSLQLICIQPIFIDKMLNYPL